MKRWVRGAGHFFGPGSALCILLAMLAVAAGCATPITTPEPAYIRVAGSTSMLPALGDLAAAYSARHPEVSIDIQGGATAVGLQLLRGGRADVATASWKIAPATGEELPALQWQALGRDGLALIVHPHNTLSNLTMERARNLFAGWYVNWPEINGKGGEIQVVSREDGSGTRDAFEARVMGDRAVTQTAVVMPSSQAAVDWVAGHPNAVAYVSMSVITSTVRAVRLEGVEPTVRTVESGTYLLARDLYLVTKPQPSRAVAEFIHFCLSPAGQAIVRKYHGKAG